MPNLYSRRQILKLSLLGLGLAACRRSPIPSPTSTSPPPSPQPSATLQIPTLTPESTTSPTVAPTLTPTPTGPFPTFIVDGHVDIAWNALEFDRDPLLSAFTGREQESGSSAAQQMGARLTGLPEWLAGRVGLIFASLFVMPADQAYRGRLKMIYSTPDQASQHAWEQLQYYRDLTQRESTFLIVQTQADLQEVISSWTNPAEQPRLGLVVLMEGAEAITSPAELPTWHAAGLRLVGPAWATTRYAAGAGEPGGLTSSGHDLLDAMAELNMVLDLSHLSDQACLEALDAYPGSIVATHANPRPFVQTERGLSDQVILQLAERHGVMGIMPFNRYLVPGWTRSSGRDGITLDRVVEAVDYVVQLTGSVDHVALGSDFDGGFGAESIPLGLESAADLPQIAISLEARGYSQEDITSILQTNWLRILQTTLPLP